MTDPTVPISEYLSDQGKRTHLLEHLASAYTLVSDLSGVIIELEHGGLTEDETATLLSVAYTMAMDLLADITVIKPILVDILTMD